MKRIILQLAVLISLSISMSAQSPVASYNFFRDTVDVSGSSNDLTRELGAMMGSTLVETAYDSCRRYMSFRDTDGYMEKSNPSLGLAATDSFTVTFWMRSADVTTDQKLIGQAQLTGGNRKGFSIGPENDVIKAEVFTGNTAVTLKSNMLNADQWYHIGVVFDQSNRFEIFVDGILDTAFVNPTIATWTAPDDAFNALRVGVAAWDINAFPYEGDLDDLQIYNTALTAAEITDIYNSVGSCPMTGDPIYVDSSATGDNNGLTWTDAYTDLQEAIDLSCNCPNADIWVAEGTYHPTQDNPDSDDNTARDKTFYVSKNVNIYGGFPTGGDVIANRDWGLNPTILSGDLGIIDDKTDNAFHVLSFQPDGADIDESIIDGVIIEKGYANTIAAGSDNTGGGIWNRPDVHSSNPMFVNCILRDNEARISGGGVYNRPKGNLSEGNLMFSNCVFTNNLAPATAGSAIHNFGFDNSIKAIITIDLCTFYNNGAIGIYSYKSLSASQSKVHINNSILWNNGSEILNFDNNGTFSDIKISYSTIQGGVPNNVTGGGGNIMSDPEFVSEGDGDLRLSTTSPAINVGSNDSIPAGITTDLNGNPRINYATVDMGAYEGDFCSAITNNIIYVDSAATGNGTGLDWTNAMTDLQEAINTSKACSGDQEIWVAKGTYHPSFDNPLSHASLPQDYTFYIDHPAKIYGGFDGAETMLSERDWSTNVTILDGAFSGTMDTALHVVLMEGPATICEDWVLDGLHVTNGRSTSTFGINSSGAGLKLIATTQASPTISNCTFYNNKAAVNGGAIDANIGGNFATVGMTITSCHFYNNQAGFNNQGRGGAIYMTASNFGSITTKVINSLFHNNTASGSNIGNGGAIYATSASMSNGTVPSPVSLEIINSTITDNHADGDGGGVYMSGDTDPFKIYNSIFWNNTGAQGDDIFTNGDQGSIDSTILSQGNNAIAALDLVVENYFTQDPLFVTPGSDYSLTQASPAINAGKDSYVPFDVYSDITGGQRILNGQVDIGAYEVAACGMDILYVDRDAGFGGDGLSWATAFTDLQNAIDISALCDGVQSIWMAEGIYQPTKAYDSNEDGIISLFESREVTYYINHDVKIYGGFNGTETSSNQRNGSLYPTILDGTIESTFGTVGQGNEPRAYHVMYIDGRDGHGSITGQTEIHDLTIQGGKNDRSFGPGVGGAGMYINGSGSGGSTDLQIRRCIFKNNSARTGGAIYNNGVNGDADFTILACIFENNEATSADGGAIYNNGYRGKASPFISITIFKNNSAYNYGGAIANSAGQGEASPSIRWSKFENNTADYGGAIYNSSSSSEMNPGSSSPAIWNSIFYKNLATKQGGAIYNEADSPQASSSPEIRNCTFSHNHANTEGEAIYNLSYVGGVVNPIVSNTIMWDVDANDEIFHSEDEDISIGHSIVKGGYTAGNNIITTYPNFVDTLNGNLKVMPMSLAVNAGSNDSIPSGLVVDFAGATRTIDGIVDIGAYENFCASPTDIIYVDNQSGGGDGSTWGAAYKEIQDAIDQSCDCGIAGQYSPIWIAGGTYYPTMDNPNSDADNFRDKSFVINKNIKIYGGFTSGDDELSDRDGSATTILSGDIGVTDDAADNAYHVVYINGRDAPIDTSCRLDGLTIRDGRADNTNSGGASSISNADGAGMYLDGLGGSCSPTLENISFLENRTTLIGILGCQGGAIFCQGESGVSSPVISNSEFHENKAGFGGAIYNNGKSGVSSPIIDTCTFEDNEAANGGYGGAIYNNGTGGVSSPEVRNSILEFNNATRGGAIYNDGSMGGVSSPVINNSTLLGNNAVTSGGAIYNYGNEGTASPTITYNFIHFNQATEGGALYNNAQGGVSSPTIINSALNANNAKSLGGAIYEIATSNGVNQSKIINCTFRGNTLRTGGIAGIKHDERIEKSNFKDVDEYGGAIYATATTGGVSVSKISNSIFWDNEDEIFITGDAAPVVDHCIVQGGYTAGTNIIDQDPVFASNLDRDWEITATSPAINAGVNDSLPVAYTLDFLGNDRINCDIVDIGAHEYQVELEIECSAPVTVNADDMSCLAASANVTLIAPTANCNIISTNNAPASFPVGSNTFKWFVVDTDGRKDTCEQIVTVEDNEDPMITCPSDTTITSGTNVILNAPITSDNCTGSLSVSNNAPTVFVDAVTTVTWIVTDAAMNQNTCDQMVTLVTTDPCEEDITIDQSPNGKASYSTNQNIFLAVQAAQSDTLLLSFGISTQALPAFEIAKGGVLEIVNTGCIED